MQNLRIGAVLAVLASFCPGAFAAAPAPAGPKDAVAQVGATVITRAALDERLQNNVMAVSYHGSPSPAQRAKYETTSLNELIEEELLFQESQQKKILLDKAEVDKIVEGEITRFGGKERFDGMLKKRGRTLEEFRKAVIQQTTVDRVKDGACKAAGKMTREEAQAHYKINREKYKKPPAYYVRHALAKVDPSALSTSTPEAEKRAQAILKDLRAGKDFMAVGKQYPKDAFNDLGWVHEGSIMPEIEAVVKSLAKDQVGGPVKTMYGFHVVQLLGRKEPEQLSFETVAEAIISDQSKARCQEAKAKLLEECKKRWPVKILIALSPQK